MSEQPALELRDVTVRYPDGAMPVTRANLTVATGQIVTLLGASGSGKSTLLRAVAGLEPLAEGEIWMHGSRVDGTPTHKRGCGMVFQDGQLFPFRSVAGNIRYGLEAHGTPREARDEIVSRMLSLVDLEGYGDRPVQTLSGGQAQRVALARSLATSPRILLLDEPLSALDRDLREELTGELRRILRESETTALYVTHDHDEAARVADRTVRILDGTLVAGDDRDR